MFNILFQTTVALTLPFFFVAIDLLASPHMRQGTYYKPASLPIKEAKDEISQLSGSLQVLRSALDVPVLS